MIDGLDSMKRLERITDSMMRKLERASHDLQSAASAVESIAEVLRAADATDSAKSLALKLAPCFSRLQRMLDSAAKRLGSAHDPGVGDRILIG